MERSALVAIMGNLDNYPSVCDNSELFEEYYNAFENYVIQGQDDEVLTMLKRRLFLPLNLPSHRNGVFIVGANPSFDEKKDLKENFMKTPKELYKSIDESKHKHWRWIADFACLSDSYQAAYLDLFPIKQTRLREFENAFRRHSDIRARLLQITHKYMTTIQLKVIVNLFAMTAYYWGFKADNPNFCNEKNMDGI